MDYAFSDDVMLSIERARSEARRLNHDSISVEHLLLGVLRAPTEAVSRLFIHLNVVPGDIIPLIEERSSSSTGVRVVGELPYSKEGKKVIEYAMREARSAGIYHVHQSHLLLGILSSSAEVVTDVLPESTIDLEEARRVLMQDD